jgi:hypothetical protein
MSLTGLKTSSKPKLRTTMTSVLQIDHEKNVHDLLVCVITLNSSTYAYLVIGPLTCYFFQSIIELIFQKTHFLKMYTPCTNIARIHMLVAPLQPAYVR